MESAGPALWQRVKEEEAAAAAAGLGGEGGRLPGGSEPNANALRGQPFAYHTFGAAAAEVELDVLTGDLEIRRADVVMDLGRSLNPAIDIGQVEGAFTQGIGLTTMEELSWGDDAHPWMRPGSQFTR